MNPNIRPTTSTELFELIQSGVKPVVKFLKGAEDFDTCIDRGMYGRIVGVEHKQDEFFIIRVDLNPFEDHNDGCMQHNYYDKDGNPTMTSKEAGMYPKDGIELVYFDYDLEIAPFFEFQDQNVTQIVPIKITSAVVHQTEGKTDFIIVDTPAPMPITGLEGNVKMMLIADEGTGVEYMKTNFGIHCEVSDETVDLLDLLAGYGIDAQQMNDILS